jgi:hypothetical protein
LDEQEATMQTMTMVKQKRPENTASKASKAQSRTQNKKQQA